MSYSVLSLFLSCSRHRRRWCCCCSSKTIIKLIINIAIIIALLLTYEIWVSSMMYINMQKRQQQIEGKLDKRATWILTKTWSRVTDAYSPLMIVSDTYNQHNMMLQNYLCGHLVFEHKVSTYSSSGLCVCRCITSAKIFL